MAMNLKNKSQVTLVATLLAIVLLLVNYIAHRHFIRWDLTEDQEYTLSPSTKKTLAELKDKVTVRLYISANLPMTLSGLKQGILDKLEEYKNYGKTHLDIEMINPDESPQTEQQAQLMGIPPLQLDVISQDKREVQKAYVGIGIFYLDKKEVIPVVSDLSQLEYNITSAILKLTTSELPKLGLMMPADGVQTYGVVQQVLEKNYEVVPVAVTDDNIEKKNLSLLLILEPRELSSIITKQLDALLQKGVSIIVIGGRVKIGDNLNATAYNTGLESWLTDKGVSLSQELVVDPRDHTYAAFSNGILQYHVPYPFFVKVTKDRLNPNNPVTSRLENLVFPWTSGLTLNKDAHADWNYDILASSSDASFLQMGDLNVSPDALENQQPDKTEKTPLAVAITTSYKNEQGVAAKLLVIANNQMITDSSLNEYDSNILLLMNSADWLSWGDALIGIRSRGATDRPIKIPSSGMISFIKFVYMIGLPLLFIFVGFILNWRRKRRWA